MQIIKQKRNHWRVEPDSTDQPYASLELRSAFDADKVWQYGWHVMVRDRDGLVIGHGGVHATAKNAAAVAIALLSA
jgi:hypothetical protein